MSQPAEPRVLVVDDEPEIVDVVAVALRFHGDGGAMFSVVLPVRAEHRTAPG